MAVHTYSNNIYNNIPGVLICGRIGNLIVVQLERKSEKTSHLAMPRLRERARERREKRREEQSREEKRR